MPRWPDRLPLQADPLLTLVGSWDPLASLGWPAYGGPGIVPLLFFVSICSYEIWLLPLSARCSQSLLTAPKLKAYDPTSGGGPRIVDYRAYIVGNDGHFIGFEPLVCADDSEAIEKAKHLASKHPVEIWSGERLVRRLNAQKPSGDAATHEKCRRNRDASVVGQLNCSKSSEQFFHFIVSKSSNQMRAAPSRSSGVVLCAISALNSTKPLSGIGEYFSR
jgi:hypothetical protein